MRDSFGLLTAGLAVIALAGCAGSPTTADLMRAHAFEARTQAELNSGLARDWDRGSALVQAGEKRIVDGEKRIRAAEDKLEEGRDQVEQGEQEVAEGRELMEESERRFRETFPDLKLPGGR
ncbi:MAG: hypothetical protein ACYDA8_23050 [Deferrisomatales bacterium]